MRFFSRLEHGVSRVFLFISLQTVVIPPYLLPLLLQSLVLPAIPLVTFILPASLQLFVFSLYLAPNFLISPFLGPIFRPFPYLHRSKPLPFPHLAPNFHLSPKLSCYPLYHPIYASTNRFIINMTLYQVCVSHVTITCTHLLSENQRGVAAGVWLPLATDLEP